MKYSVNALKGKARQALLARDNGDERWMQLVLTLSVRTGLHPDAIAKKIEALAA